MASDTDLSSFIHSKESALPKSTREISAIQTWAHTRDAIGDEPSHKGKKKILYCKHCETYNSEVTSNFWRHLRNRHQIVINEAESSKPTPPQDQLDQALLNEALVSLVTQANLSFRIVESPEFQSFCQILNPAAKDYLTTAHSTVRSLAETMWQSQKDLLRKRVQSALSSIHISLDIWTSPNRVLLLGICGHFFHRNSEKLCKSLLALRPVASHSGEAQFETLLNVLQDYGIIRKIGAIVCDNATSNDVLCRILSTYLEEEEDIRWKPVFHRVRCIGHVINLAVLGFLFPGGRIERPELIPESDAEEAASPPRTVKNMGPLGKLHNIAVYIRNSPNRTKEFKDLAGRTITLDNRTRWNSWFLMVEAAMECHSAIDVFVKNHSDLDDDYLERSDWKKLEQTRGFLKPFYQATMHAQGDSATVDRVLFVMDILIQHLDLSLVGF